MVCIIFIYLLGKPSGDVQARLQASLQEVGEKYRNLEETEKEAVRSAMVEERSRFCHFVTCLAPVVVSWG